MTLMVRQATTTLHHHLQDIIIITEKEDDLVDILLIGKIDEYFSILIAQKNWYLLILYINVSKNISKLYRYSARSGQSGSEWTDREYYENSQGRRRDHKSGTPLRDERQSDKRRQR